MFGKIKNPLIGVILFAFCLYIIRLYARRDIGLYINPRYFVFALVMALVAGVILILGAVWRPQNNHLHASSGRRFAFIDWLVIGVLIMAFVLPAKTLSLQTVKYESTTVPEALGYTNQSPYEPCPARDSAMSVVGWVNLIDNYPASCSEGQPITFTGFVVQSTADNPLPDDMYYLSRLVIFCCIIDARPYGLPVQRGDFGSYPNETWLKVTGTLQRAVVNDEEEMVIVPTSVDQQEEPARPYD